MSKKNKPNFLIVGAPKSGTTSIYEYLKQHPQIYVNAKIKESNFFVEPKEVLGAGPRFYGIESYGRTVDDYEKLFEDVTQNHIAVGEVCSVYLPFFKNTIQNIKNYLNDDVKIIIILRNPIERAYSHYMHNVRDTDETLTFEEALTAEEERIKQNYWNSFHLTRLSFYYSQVQAYKENFKNVKVYLFEDLRKDDFFIDLFKFLEVDTEININTKKNYNISGRPKNVVLQKFLVNDNFFKRLIKGTFKYLLSRNMKDKLSSIEEKMINKNIEKEKMNPSTRDFLKELFKDDIEKLSILINRDLSHWLK